MTLSISLHLLMMILLSSIVSCFLMITSSTRFFHSIKTNHSMCSFVVDKFETCRKKERERESELVSENGTCSYRYTPSPPARDLLHMCCCILSFFLMRTTRKRWRSILFSLCMCLLMISCSLLKYSIDLSHTCAFIHLIKFIRYSDVVMFEKEGKKTRENWLICILNVSKSLFNRTWIDTQ